MHIIVDPSLTQEFIPEFNGNKDADAKERISVTILAPTTKLINELLERPKLIMKTNEKNEMTGGEMAVEVDVKRIVCRMVTSIRNLSVGDKDLPLLKGDDLFGDNVPGEVQELIDELGKECQRRLNQRLDTKN